MKRHKQKSHRRATRKQKQSPDSTERPTITDTHFVAWLVLMHMENGRISIYYLYELVKCYKYPGEIVNYTTELGRMTDDGSTNLQIGAKEVVKRALNKLPYLSVDDDGWVMPCPHLCGGECDIDHDKWRKNVGLCDE